MSSTLVKENAKARMMRNIAQLWGADDVEIEAAFDPLVSMLIEVCANEIEKINNEIENTHTRLISRLAQLLTPDILTGYKPAHAIMHASPAEFNCIIKPETQFYFTKEAENETNSRDKINKEIFYSPTSIFKLVNAEIKYLACNSSIYENVNAYQKKIIIEAEGGEKLDYGTLWIGIELHGAEAHLDNVSFYFDLKNNPAKNAFIYSLQYAKWSVDDLPLKVTYGLMPKAENRNILETQFDTDKILMNEIEDLYTNQFITITNIAETKQKLPEIFDTVFLRKDLAKLSSKCLWLRVEFPALITGEILNDIMCSVNCFPVVNKRLNESTFRLSQNLNIVPLKTNDFFFSMKSASSQEGIVYSGSSSNVKNLGAGSYIMRQSGVERFDSRNAIQLITYLLNLLRDEIGAFSILGNEFIASNLRELRQTLALIEQRVDSNNDVRESTKYLFVNPKKEDDNLFVSFWTTNGLLANNIKAGSKPALYESCDLQSESIILLTTTRGGRDKLDDMGKLAAFKTSLLSRNRIVTIEDIKAFCFNELGKEIENVTVKKGFSVSNDRKSGFIQTLEVRLKISKITNPAEDNWKDVCENISTKIMKNSTALMPVRVLIE